LALKQVDLQVNAGSKVAIMGPSGSGKSTLLQLIGGLDVPTSGEVIVSGQPVHKLNDAALSDYRNQYIGFIFQTFNLQSFYTARENVALPLILGGVSSREAMGRAGEALDQVGLGDKQRRMPAQLSGGEMQRVAIARALVHKPRVILADEPTANLDRDNAELVLNLIEQLELGDQALVVVTHDDRVASRFERMVVLHHGEVRREE
jgi:ABC-type lipoprotein export system ATPase subunit